MKLYFHRSAEFLLLCALFALPNSIRAQDQRTSPIDALLLMDATPAMNSVRREAIDWVCTSFVDGILQNGDRITLWSVSEQPGELISQTISSNADKDSLKAIIQSIAEAPGPANYKLALGIAAEREKKRTDRDRIFFTLLVGVYFEEMDANQGKVSYNGIDLLKNSRVTDFPGWKAIVVGLGLDDAINKAAAIYNDKPPAASSEAQGR